MESFNKISAKEFFRIFGIFFGIIVVFIGTSIGFIKLSEKSWKNNLKEKVQAVLDEKYPDEWQILDFKRIENPFYLSAACYEIINEKTHAVSNAIIIRTETLYGPYPAVFVCDGENDAEFIGYSSINGRIKNLMEARPSDFFISYWERRIPEIISR